MIYVSIFACALALAAVAFAALALTTLSRLTREVESRAATMLSNSRALAAKLVTQQREISDLKSTAPAALQAQVAELTDAVARLAKTQQRFAGKFYATTRQAETNGLDVSDPDPELSELLSLQNAPPAKP